MRAGLDFYNDNDRHACAWTRELIRAGLIPEGVVDERPIQALTGKDLEGYRRVHLFSGIAGWAYALELAGWPATRPVFTGSVPCQPFSAAGKRKGQADERHLWPVFIRLIRECQPGTCFGEQVASDDGYRWLARVRDDLEEAGYAVGCADLPACCAGAPHRRQRLFWVAVSQRSGVRGSKRGSSGSAPKEVSGEVRKQRLRTNAGACSKCVAGRLANIQVNGRRQRSEDTPGSGAGAGTEGVGGGPADDSGERGGVGDTDGHRCDGEPVCLQPRRPQQESVEASGAGDTFWSNSVLIPCRDGKWRRVPAGANGPELSLFPLAARLPGRVGILRGAGNSIVPAVAAVFIKAFLEKGE